MNTISAAALQLENAVILPMIWKAAEKWKNSLLSRVYNVTAQTCSCQNPLTIGDYCCIVILCACANGIEFDLFQLLLLYEEVFVSMLMDLPVKNCYVRLFISLLYYLWCAQNW